MINVKRYYLKYVLLSSNFIPKKKKLSPPFIFVLTFNLNWVVSRNKLLLIEDRKIYLLIYNWLNWEKFLSDVNFESSSHKSGYI